MTLKELVIPVGASIVAFIIAAILAMWVSKQKPGTQQMLDISNAVGVGAMAFLRREFRIVIPVAIGLAVLIGAAIGFTNGIAFAVGAGLSAIAGLIALKITVKAAVRAANASGKGLGHTFALAFRGGATVGLAVPAMALLGMSLLYFAFPSPITIAGVGIGASLIALFIRVGGGIFTKAADMGADLVGKVEANIPEDDPRNPATIADNVGDNVGDAAGMGSDIYESYIVTMLASLLIAGLIELHSNLLFYPMLVGASGLFASIIGIATITPRKMTDVNKPLANAFYVSAAIAIALNFVFTYLFLGRSQIAYALFGSTVIGVILVPVIQRITDYFTSYRFKPVQEISASAKWGYASLTLMGIIQGMRSTGPFMIAIVVALATSYVLASSAAPDPTQSTLYGIFGTSLTAMAMLSLAGIVLSIDAFGPISDNAGGIVEMTGMGEENRKVTDEIDAVGNTTKAVTKGFAIASAGLAALAMIQAFQYEAIKVFPLKHFDYSLSNPAVVIGLLVGGLLPFFITSQLIAAVTRAASKMVEEVRRQFKEIPDILTGKVKPDYAKCVDVATVASLRELWKSATITIAAPIILGIILGPSAVVGLLMGAVITGIFLAFHLANTGGAWDNAKKYMEINKQKGTEEHKIAIVGDIIGDPYKDTAGPALNTVIKLLNTVAIVFVSAFVAIFVL
jgi:K(+)-stimulated pyrophosphate-energized sodium pump